jgi:hypothetical protein
MPVGPKHPGLQQKFEDALRVLLKDGATLKAREIVTAISKDGKRFRIASAECGDLETNSANYMNRAKAAEVVESGGPWAGYWLHALETSVQEASSLQAEAEKTDKPPGASKRQHWESFLHLPLTVALSGRFSGRVKSLPNATDSVRWGNPDMLMLRPSPLERLQEYNADLSPTAFRVVDVTPECILASIEVKGGLERDRPSMFTAIAEVAANSRWANEAWLVFVDWKPHTGGLDEDIVALARSVEVGLLEVVMTQDSDHDDAWSLETALHHAAPTRATLRIGELTEKRIGVLGAALRLLTEWSSEPEQTFLDVDHADQKARVLLHQAVGNLRTQKGFSGGGPLRDLLAPLIESDADAVSRALRATLRSAASLAAMDDESSADLLKAIVSAADTAMVRTVAEDFERDLAAFVPAETAGV